MPRSLGGTNLFQGCGIKQERNRHDDYGLYLSFSEYERGLSTRPRDEWKDPVTADRNINRGQHPKNLYGFGTQTNLFVRLPQSRASKTRISRLPTSSRQRKLSPVMTLPFRALDQGNEKLILYGIEQHENSRRLEV